MYASCTSYFVEVNYNAYNIIQSAVEVDSVLLCVYMYIHLGVCWFLFVFCVAVDCHSSHGVEWVWLD